MPLNADISNLVVTAIGTGVEFVVPKLVNWILPFSSLDELLNKEDVIARREIVLQDGTILIIEFSEKKMPQLFDALRKYNESFKKVGKSPDEPTYTTCLHTFNQESKYELGGSFNLAELLGISW